jgi:hypothetical protein
MDLNVLMKAMEKTAAEATKPIKVPTKEWGDIYVRPRTVEEVDNETDKDKDKDGKKRRLARGASRIMCDENGKRLFDENKEEHLSLLEKQPWTLLQKVLSAVDLDPK